MLVGREEIGADRVEGIAQFAFAGIERKSQKSDYVAAKLPESQDVIGLCSVIRIVSIVSHTTSRVWCAGTTIAKADRLPQSAWSETLCNPTLT